MAAGIFPPAWMLYQAFDAETCSEKIPLARLCKSRFRVLARP